MKQLALVLVIAACGGSSSNEAIDASPRSDAEVAVDGDVDAASGCPGGAAPSTEVCDGVLDEDCDGLVDEDCPADPFDAASCGGPPMTAADALAQLGGATRAVLASATIQVRTRTCEGQACGPWSANSNWVTHFLTYSGGVSTRYKDVQADTRLVLYVDAGAPKLSLQHVTFTQGGYPDRDGIVFGLPPAPQMYPVFRAFNVMKQFPSDYDDLEWTLKNGELELGTRCARFTAVAFGVPEPSTTTYAALYRW